MTRILVTGATGTVGRAVLASLADRDAVARAAVRDPDGADSPADEVVAFDFGRPETWGPALQGVDGVFLMRPPTVDADRVVAFAEAAGRVGVDRVAYLSTLGADRNVLIPHHRIERGIAAAGVEHSVRYTFLRASFFTQNLLSVHRPEIVDHGEVLVPAGDGRTSFVDARDVGAVAAAVLTDPDPPARAYDLTGPAALTYDEVAAVFSEVLDRRVTYPRPSIRAFVSRMRDRGEPWPFVLLMVGIYTTARLGLAGRVTDDVERVLGRPPRTVREFVADHAEAFRPEGPTPDRENSIESADETAIGPEK